jgi:hypothetical protein
MRKHFWSIHCPDGKYIPSKLFTLGDHVTSGCIDGFVLDLEELFTGLD